MRDSIINFIKNRLRGDEPTGFEVLLKEIIHISEETLQKIEIENEQAMVMEPNERN